jgi:hypothetical protein
MFGMTDDEIKVVLASIREQLDVLTEKGWQISAAMRQAIFAKIIWQIQQIESGLKLNRRET